MLDRKQFSSTRYANNNLGRPLQPLNMRQAGTERSRILLNKIIAKAAHGWMARKLMGVRQQNSLQKGTADSNGGAQLRNLCQIHKVIKSPIDRVRWDLQCADFMICAVKVFAEGAHVIACVRSHTDAVNESYSLRMNHSINHVIALRPIQLIPFANKAGIELLATQHIQTR